MGRIEGEVSGDYVRLGPSHNAALVELLLGAEAKKTLKERGYAGGDVIIFRGHDGDGEYMGWRTGSDEGLEVVARHSL